MPIMIYIVPYRYYTFDEPFGSVHTQVVRDKNFYVLGTNNNPEPASHMSGPQHLLNQTANSQRSFNTNAMYSQSQQPGVSFSQGGAFPVAMGQPFIVNGPQPLTPAGLALLGQQQQLSDHQRAFSLPPLYPQHPAGDPLGYTMASMPHYGAAAGSSFGGAPQSAWNEPTMPTLAHIATRMPSANSLNASMASGMSGSIRAASSGGTGAGVMYPLRALGVDGSPGSPYAQGAVGSSYTGVPVSGAGPFSPLMASTGRRHSHGGPPVAPQSPRSTSSEVPTMVPAVGHASDSGVAQQQLRSSLLRQAQANSVVHQLQRQGSGVGSGGESAGVGSPKPPRPPVRSSPVSSAEPPVALETHLPQPKW